LADTIGSVTDVYDFDAFGNVTAGHEPAAPQSSDCRA
jgi:hypothetical protein